MAVATEKHNTLVYGNKIAATFIEKRKNTFFFLFAFFFKKKASLTNDNDNTHDTFTLQEHWLW